MAETADSKQGYSKIDLGEFIKITKWVFLLVYKSHPWLLISYLGSEIILEWQDLVYAFIFSKAIDQLISTAQVPGATLESLYPYLIFLLAYTVVQTIMQLANSYAITTLRITNRYDTRKALYFKLNSLGIQTLEIPEVNDKITRANDYLGNVLPYLNETVRVLARGIKLLTTLVLVVSFMPIFVLILAVSMIPFILFDKKMRSVIYKFDYDTTERGRISGSISGDLSNSTRLHEIGVTGAFNFLDKKFSDIQEFLINFRLKFFKQWRTGNYALGFLTDLTLLYGYIQIFQRLISKIISVGDVVFWMRTFQILQNALQNLLVGFNDLFEFSLQLKDTYRLFQTKPVLEDGTVELPVMSKGPKIEFKDLSFVYPNGSKKALDNISITLEPGEKVAIVGHNGAGKTTLIKLLTRFYLPTKGNVLVNETDIKEIKLETLYKNMGVLFQDFNTYPVLSVKDNIAIGHPDMKPDIDRIKTAAAAADATDFIEDYPNKYDQMLSEKIKGGTRPSTGQWQKIALARFFYRNSPLVIFDEPTAAIDPMSEYNIFNKIYEFFKGKTVIIVSHRFSTVRNADRIIVLEKGKILEEGTHKELMDKNGYYAKAFNLQARGYNN